MSGERGVEIFWKKSTIEVVQARKLVFFFSFTIIIILFHAFIIYFLIVLFVDSMIIWLKMIKKKEDMKSRLREYKSQL